MMEIDELVKLAKEDDWDKIDVEIPTVCNVPEYVQWSYDEGIEDDDGNVRDLGVSIIEKTTILEELFEDNRDRIYALMQNDENVYVRYRAAFALVAHGPGDYRDDVIKTLKEAENTIRFLSNHLAGRMGEAALSDMEMKADDWAEAIAKAEGGEDVKSRTKM